jgi:hypothetical protein
LPNMGRSRPALRFRKSPPLALANPPMPTTKPNHLAREDVASQGSLNWTGPAFALLFAEFLVICGPSSEI